MKLDVNKKLTRAVGITKGGATEKYLVKFEKLPTFCNACGFMGYWHEECGTGEHDESKFECGSFLLANKRGRGGGRGGRDAADRQSNGEGDYTNRGRGFGRSTGRGRGNNNPQTEMNTERVAPVIWRHNYVYNKDVVHGGLDGENVTSSENQDVVTATTGDNILGKRTAENSNIVPPSERTSNAVSDPKTALVPFAGSKSPKSPESATVVEKVNMFEGDMEEDERNTTLVDTPQKNANRKRLKGREGQAVNSNQNLTNETGSATPLEGDRREQ